MVAFTRLIGFCEPSDFESTSRMPASSSTARTPPPAITPVPSEAGFRNTRPAPNTPVTWCVIVLPFIGTLKRFFLARSTPFWIASGTSLALPYPTPTTDFSSPTTTRAVNEKRRPPLTTFATRLISMTRSCRSRPFGLTLSTAIERTKLAGLPWRPSELQASLAGALGDRRDAAVEAISAPVEDAGLHPGGLGALGEQLPGALGLLHRAELAELILGPGGRGDRAARVVVDQLREDAAVRPVHGQARALRAAADAGADAPAAAQSLLWLGENSHGLGPLPDLAGDVLAGVAHAPALVGLRRPRLADARGGLADQLLVDPADHDLGRLRDLELDALGGFDRHGV